MGGCFGKTWAGGETKQGRPSRHDSVTVVIGAPLPSFYDSWRRVRGKHALGLRWAPSLEMASKLRTRLYQCLALGVFGWFVGGEKGAVRTQDQQGSGHEKGETRARRGNALNEARRETCEGKLNQVMH